MLTLDVQTYPYASQRTTVHARNGMVATSQPLAAQAGLEILKRGGNAVDAAIATAAALVVVEPTSNGLGGDAFAIVWIKDKLHGLNASGPAPAALTLEAMQAAGHSEMPLYGWAPVTVPGCPAAWASLSERFGNLSLEEALAPAIKLAREGFPVSPTVSRLWQREYETYRDYEGDREARAAWFETFAPQGRAPRAGEIFRAPGQAESLAAIAESGAKEFYAGELAQKIDAFARQSGGYIRAEDLAAYEPEWVEPIAVKYRGYDIWEIPPNGHGLVALMALQILKGFPFEERETLESYHRQIEAMKLAYVDGQKYVAEPSAMSRKVEELLSEDYAAVRRALIGERALTPEPGDPRKGGTVYLAAADGEGNMISFIQSNYHGFGSGLVVPGTGITLQNRGANFSLDPGHDNVLAPGKRPYHTIIPGFITKGGVPLGPFGVMGGFMQPQGHAQVVMNLIDFGLNPQAALDAPRWRWNGGKRVSLEQAVPAHIAQGLAERGHEVALTHDAIGFGRGQVILRDPETGVLTGGTEPRADGHIACW